jgi:hypothetical protein
MKYDKLLKPNEVTMIFYDGYGSKTGIPQDKDFHPDGRMNSLVVVYKGLKEVFRTKYASSLPDSLSDTFAANYNDKRPIPTIPEGMYSLYTTMHRGKYEAFEVGYGDISVIRGGKMSTSSGINVHYRNTNDPYSYASSAGCPTITTLEIKRLIKILGITNFSKVKIGSLIVDRSNISEKLAKVYSGYYGDMFDRFSSYYKEDTDLALLLKEPVEVKEDKALKIKLMAIHNRIENDLITYSERTVANLNEFKQLIDKM